MASSLNTRADALLYATGDDDCRGYLMPPAGSFAIAQRRHDTLLMGLAADDFICRENFDVHAYSSWRWLRL